MDLHKKSETRLLAELSASDLSDYRLSFDELDADSARTAEIIYDILDRAKAALDWTVPAAGSVNIDVLPEVNGGCIFLFTVRPMPKKRFRVKTEDDLLLCRCASIDDFLALLKTCKWLNPKNAAVGFRLGTEFVLLQSVRGESAAYIHAVLSEFGEVTPADRLTRLYLEEHGEKITLPQEI